MASSVINSKVYKTSRGSRIYFDSRFMEKAGFEIGKKLKVTYNKDEIEICLDQEGDNRVSQKRRSGGVVPLIDLRNQAVAACFDENTPITVSILNGRIKISLSEIRQNKIEREESLLNKLHLNKPLAKATLCAGGGISSHAIRAGFSESGIKTKQTLMAERDPEYLNCALRQFPDTTYIHQANIEDIPLEAIPKADVLSFSLPCTGHSRAGKSANGIKTAESHKDASTSIFGLVKYIWRSNPAIMISENVVEAKDSTTYTLLRFELERLGYTTFEWTLDHNQAGALERRKRWWFVAVSSGLKIVDFDPIAYIAEAKKIEEILEPSHTVAPSSLMPIDYYSERQAKNTENGRGFSENLVSKDASGCTTIPRNYQKRQISNPHFIVDEKHIRLFTPVEHARLKGIPEEIIKDISPTRAHEILGQSILYNHAKGIVEALGNQLTRLVGKSIKTMAGNKNKAS